MAACGSSPAKHAPDLGSASDMAEVNDLGSATDLGMASDLASPPPQAEQIALSGPSTIATYTCPAFTVTIGATATKTPVALGGAGAGAIYATSSDCKAGTSPVASVAVAAHATTATFYYRSATAGAITLSGSAAGFTAGSLPITVNAFQVLGQPDLTSEVGLQNGMAFATGICVAGSKLFVADGLPLRCWAEQHQREAGLPPVRPRGGPVAPWAFQRAPPASMIRTAAPATGRIFRRGSWRNPMLGWSTIPTSTVSPAISFSGNDDRELALNWKRSREA